MSSQVKLSEPHASPPAAGAGALTPAQEARLEMRAGRFTARTTRNVALGYVQSALVVIEKDLAFDFLVFCQRNQRPCPVVEVLDVGDPEPKRAAPGADIRTDLALYSVYRKGELVETTTEIGHLWRDDLVAFLIGSNTSCDQALRRAGVQTTENRWVLRTAIPTVPAGPFHGPLVVTMRWLSPEQAITATQLTSRFPFNHGAPIHIGDPAAIGAELDHPLTGDPVGPIPPGVVPVFWACSMTPQEIAIAAKIDFMITSGPSKGFITDLESDKVCSPS